MPDSIAERKIRLIPATVKHLKESASIVVSVYGFLAVQVQNVGGIYG